MPARPAVLEALTEYGCSLEGASEGSEVSVEALMNRPDLFSVEGLARALGPFLAVAAPPQYTLRHGPLAVIVDPSVREVRPEIAAAVVRGVAFDEAGLARLIQTQEKFDLTVGRRRARVSIGIHDLAPLHGPITYKALGLREVKFRPLFAEGMPGGARDLTPEQVLEQHPKGREYAAILAGKPRVPFLVDHKGTVLSMPPIINGTATEVKPGTRDLFLDVTGTQRAAVEGTAKLLAMLLADRGGTIETVEVRRPGEAAFAFPDLSPATHRVDLARASALVGAPLRADEVAGSLERLGHRALIVPGGAAVDARAPPWRLDLLHEVDLIEDIAVGLGYRNIGGRMPAAPTIGEEHGAASLARRARTALAGLGFLEVMTLTLSSPDEDAIIADASPPLPAAVANPISRDHSTLRRALTPSLLAVLRANTQRDLPQAIFEVGDAVRGGRNETRMAGAYLGRDASFTRAKGIVQGLFGALGVTASFLQDEAPPFVKGRCAAAMLGDASAGHFGEIAPAVLERFGLTHPAVSFEFSLAVIARPSAG